MARFPNAPGRNIPSATRSLVQLRDLGLCVYCGEPGPSLDHVLAWDQGGDHHLLNLVACCRSCNSIAGERYFPQFTEKRVYVQARRAQLGALRLARVALLTEAGRPVSDFV